MNKMFHRDTRSLAYDQTSGREPGIVFLGGFRSDKSGTKALYLEEWSRARGRSYLRFDYSGHGSSGGDVLDYGIGDWADDAEAIIRGLTQGPQVLVGSSMGGWIALLLARRMPEWIAGLVTVAAAPDFTEEHYWKRFSEEQRTALEKGGQVAVPSDYDDEPYVITCKLIENGRQQLVLNEPLHLACPTRMLQGTEDTAVPVEHAIRLFEHVSGPDVRLTLVKGADHRFSDQACLDLLGRTVGEVVGDSVSQGPDELEES